MKRLILTLAILAALSAHAKQYTVTGYCGCAVCCGQAGQPTASGKMPAAGVTCAGPRAMPFGTVLNIPGVGDRIVQDRLAKRYDSRIDIFFATHNEAKQFGIRKLNLQPKAPK